jgi:hypothetical protein
MQSFASPCMLAAEVVVQGGVSILRQIPFLSSVPRIASPEAGACRDERCPAIHHAARAQCLPGCGLEGRAEGQSRILRGRLQPWLEGRLRRRMGANACPAVSPHRAHANDVTAWASFRREMNTRSRAACDLGTHACPGRGQRLSCRRFRGNMVPTL